MNPSRHLRAFSVLLLLFAASLAGAATTDFRVFLDTDRNAVTGCTVAGMSGVDQVLVTRVTDTGSIARVTRVFRQLCSGSALGTILDDDPSGWTAVLESGELSFETRMRQSAFGPDGIGGDVRVGFEASRLTAKHVALVNVDGSDAVLFDSAPRRRATRAAGSAREIVLDGNLADWTGLNGAMYGMASGGTRDLRLLRVFAWADPAEPSSEAFLYFAVVVRLTSDAPFADDDVYSRRDGQSLSVAGPGVLANDGDPFGQDLDPEIVTEPARGSVTLNGEEGGFTYSPDHPQSKATDSFEYRVLAGTRQSNVARVRIDVWDGSNEPPSFTPGGDVTVDETSGLYQERWATEVSPGPGEIQNVVFTVTSDNDGLFSTPPVIAPDGTLRFVPFPNLSGSSLVTVTLRDSEGASTPPSTFTILVRDVNHEPDFTLGRNHNVAEDAGAQTVSSWVSGINPGPADESSQAVVFRITRNTNPALFSVAPAISPAGVLTYTSAPNAHGTATITVRAQDDGVPSASSEKRFTITIHSVNDQPSFTPGPNVVVVDTAGPRTVAGWATSMLAGPANESSQTLQFLVTNASPALFSVAPAVAPNGTLTFTPAVGQDGVAMVNVQVRDNGGTASGGVDTSVSHAFLITVERAPTVTSASGTTFTAGQPGTFTVTSAGRPLPTIAQGGALPSGVTFVDGTGVNQGTATLSGTPEANTAGVYPLTFQATNSRGSSPVQNFTLIVNGAPAITTTDTATFKRGIFSSFVVETAGYPYASIALSGPALPAGLTFTDLGDGTATLSGKPKVAVGSYGGFTLTAANGTGTNATQTFTIDIGTVVYPMPGSKAEPPVVCIGCEGNNPFGQSNAGLPAYPYDSPIVEHVGRYVDSQTTGNFQHVGIRTIRARTIRLFPDAAGDAPPRLYIQMGNAVGAYNLNDFFTRLPSGVSSAREIAPGVDRWGAPIEKLFLWDGYLYPEAASAGWFAPLVDQQDPLGKGTPFDADDRGYLYAGYPTFGWGIARDDGRTTRTHFPKVVQMMPGGDSVDQNRYPNTRDDDSGVPPDSVGAFRVGANYYAVTASPTASHAIFNVTDPTNPQRLTVRTGSQFAMRKYDRFDGSGHLAYIDGSRVLRIVTYADLVSNGVPLASFPATAGGFVDLAFDPSGNLWAAEATKIWKFTPGGGGYTATSYSPFGAAFNSIRALAVGAGHIAVSGTDRTGAPKYDVRLARIDAGALTDVPLDGFFKNYYHGGLGGYAEPGQYTLPADLQLVPWNGKTYLMYSVEGLGDVFEMNLP